MLTRHVVRQDDGAGGERHVHAERHDEDGDEHLGPVDLVDGLEGGDDLAHAEGDHGDQHDKRDGRVREHEACCSGCQEPAEQRWRVLRTHQQGGLSADFFEEAPAVVDPWYRCWLGWNECGARRAKKDTYKCRNCPSQYPQGLSYKSPCR